MIDIHAKLPGKHYQIRSGDKPSQVKYIWIYVTNTGIPEIEVNRNFPVPLLFNYSLKLLYAAERTKFSYQINSHQVFNHRPFLKFVYLFLATLGLCCCAWAFSSCGERRLLFVVVRGLLIAVASLVTEHGLQVHRLQQLWRVDSVVVARRLQSAGSVVVAHGLSCSAVCGIFLDQGSNPCPLHWQADS